MTYQIIDNFLDEEEFLKIKSSILNPHFSWSLTTYVSDLEENLKTTSSYYFTHLFYSGFLLTQIAKYFQNYWTN